jgi:hypothetical protein
MRPFGVKEVARSGAVALARGDDARLRLVDFEPPTGTDEDRPGVRLTENTADMTGNV